MYETDLPKCVLDWTEEHVRIWFSKNDKHNIAWRLGSLNGELLLLLREDDLKNFLQRTIGDTDWPAQLSLLNVVRKLQLENTTLIEELGYDPSYIISGLPNARQPNCILSHPARHVETRSNDGRATHLKPELVKTFISLVYLFVVTWITAFVMVIVHNRVPDMKKYPPLPDIFLDNVPHIPWAFAMCECTASLLMFTWVAVLLFHKHRCILLRRFFALSGTVFLLRCVTMLITSLSVPGSHLQCNPMAEELLAADSLSSKMRDAYTIWSGAGLSIQGVRTCGDYMFSGHTAALTILNFFITEYTPRHLYFMHTFSWMLNMFGIFFILSAHEHYSIDVFIAFYITSRLFLYYHTLANNQALMQRDSNRTRIWFPLFSFFESEIDGIIPNEFDTPSSLVKSLFTTCRKGWDSFYTISMQRALHQDQKVKAN